MPTVAPYGSWHSPITSELIVSESIRLGQPQIDGDTIYWLEGRPLEGGRNVLVRRTADGQISDLTPAGFNVRTRVHEYGGGAYLVVDDVIYFANDSDQQLYVQRPGEDPRALTAESALRYTDMVIDPRRNRLICVCENHDSGGTEAENLLAAIDLATGTMTPLQRGRDFYAAPRLSPDGSQLAWLSWGHPHLPWDAAELWIATVQEDGSLAGQRQLAGGVGDAAFQPEWGSDRTLYVVAERTGWWNLYAIQGDQTSALHPIEAEFGQPTWLFRTTTYAVIGPDRLLCSYCVAGIWHLAILDHAAGSFSPVDLPYHDIAFLHANAHQAVFLAGSPTKARTVVRLDLATLATEELGSSSSVSVDPGFLSIPETIEFPTTGNRSAYGFFYPPKNEQYAAPAGELPPLLVMSHGGPTGSTEATLDLKVQYWTSRGFGVLDVNYGGSTGYGRDYRERLNGMWGIVDVDDCTNGAKYLVEQGRVDGNRLAITGGSAGGYTTLAALTFRDVFKAGASHFGIGDLEAFVGDTHKFESRYIDGLVGPYPERRELYIERSPIHHISQLECPTIFFQGLEDKIVPPNQAEAMVAALRMKGIPVAYLPFEGEQHGFRRAANIRRSLDGEFYFYSRVFGYTPAEAIEPVDIEHM